MFCFSLDDSGKNIYKGIKETKRLEVDDFRNKDLLLHSIHNKFHTIVVEAIKQKGLQILTEDNCHMFSIPKEEALMFRTE